MGCVREDNNNENNNGEARRDRKGIIRVNATRRRIIRRRTSSSSSAMIKCNCCCHCVLQYPTLLESASEFLSTIPTHAVFIFLNPLMVDLLQVEFQNKDKSPFQTHAPNMWIFFASTCVHCLGLAFEMKIQTSSGTLLCSIITNFILFSGALSSLSLASVFLPRALGWLCLSLSTVLPFVALALPFLFSASKWFCSKLSASNKLCLPK